MDTYYQEHESRVLIVILSIALHTLALLLLFVFHYSADIADNEYLKSHLADASQMLSQSPQQGPQVIFQDEPEPQQAAAPTQNTAPTQPTTAMMPIEEHLESLSDYPEILQEPEHAVTEPQSQEQETTNQQYSSAAEPTQSLMPTTDTQYAPSDYAQPAYDTYTQEIPFRQTGPRAQPTKQGPKRKQRTYSGRPSQQAITALGNLTQGFIKSSNQQQGAVPKAQADMDHLARTIYTSKVLNAFRQSVNAQQKPTLMHKDFTTSATITITIDRSGKLLEFIFDHPNKTYDLLRLEQLLRDGAQQAGLYPPIPESLGTDIFTKKLNVSIQAASGMQTFSSRVRERLPRMCSNWSTWSATAWPNASAWSSKRKSKSGEQANRS